MNYLRYFYPWLILYRLSLMYITFFFYSSSSTYQIEPFSFFWGMNFNTNFFLINLLLWALNCGVDVACKILGIKRPNWCGHFLFLDVPKYVLQFLIRDSNVYLGACTHRRLDKHPVVHQQPGPLQTIFNLLPDEVKVPYLCLDRGFLIEFLSSFTCW